MSDMLILVHTDGTERAGQRRRENNHGHLDTIDWQKRGAEQGVPHEKLVSCHFRVAQIEYNDIQILNLWVNCQFLMGQWMVYGHIDVSIWIPRAVGNKKQTHLAKLVYNSNNYGLWYL